GFPFSTSRPRRKPLSGGCHTDLVLVGLAGHPTEGLVLHRLFRPPMKPERETRWSDMQAHLPSADFVSCHVLTPCGHLL
ncbi:hypothetical protein XENOCAPTIV_021402, partial [Xenoophorus captivus]